MNAPSSYSRRDFITACAGTVAVLSMARRATASTSPDREPVNGRCLHVFSKPLRWLSCANAARLVAEAGFEGIDYAVRTGGHVAPDRVRDELPRAIDAAHAAGLKVEMITTGITRPDDPHTRGIVETAAKCGVKYYRMGRFDYDLRSGVWNTLQKLKPQMAELARLNENHGIHGAIQNHAGRGVGAACWDVFELMRDLDPRWLGCQYDIRHAVAEGGESWPVALQLLQPWIRCTNLKDFRWKQAPGKATIEDVPLGEGIVDFDAYFHIERQLGIGGPRSIHFEYAPFEPPLEHPTQETRAIFLAAMRKDRRTLSAALGREETISK